VTIDEVRGLAITLLPPGVFGYLVGACPFGLWLGRWFKGVDVRTVGSKNMGATNVYRSLGPALGITTLLLDAAKGAVPVWVASRFLAGGGPFLSEAAGVVAGLGAVLGHVFSFWTGFKGGKGVATTAGVLLALAPLAFAAFAVVFVATVAISRYISLGSTLGALAFLVAMIATRPAPLTSPRVWLGAILVVLIVWRHRENYARLARGEERRFSLRSGGAT
jgi:acyl phosphate:glycerol-3-phosphate acyltransferase